MLLVTATVTWAAGLNFLLDHSTWHGLPHRVWYSGLISDGDPAGILLVWLVLVLVLAVTGRLWLTLALTLDLTLIVAAANTTKVRMRTEPLYPDDLGFLTSPGFLVRMVSARPARAGRRRPGGDHRRAAAGRVGSRPAASATCIARRPPRRDCGSGWLARSRPSPASGCWRPPTDSTIRATRGGRCSTRP